MQFEDIGKGRFYNADCFDVMSEIPDGCIDMILCDLPYGTTACKWDTVLPFDKLWEQYWRIAKPNAAIVLTATFPFTAALAISQIELCRYSLVWDKVNKYTGSMLANKRPLRRHEDILIFCKGQTIYNKQYRYGKAFIAKQTKGHGEYIEGITQKMAHVTINTGQHNPCSVIQIKGDNKKELGLHPTQKPIELFEYLIKTYSNEGDVIIDNCAGSGTTAIACENTNRKWVCIEKDKDYYTKAVQRIKDHAKVTTTKSPQETIRPAPVGWAAKSS